MKHVWRWQALPAAAALLLVLALAFPNWAPDLSLQNLPRWMQIKAKPRGIEQGGVQILLEMDTSELRINWLKAVEAEARRELRGERDPSGKTERVGYGVITIQDGALRVALRGAADKDAVLTRLMRVTQPLPAPLLGRDLDVEADGTAAVLIKPTVLGMEQKTGAAIEASMQIIRRRIDALNTGEPVIQRQGGSRILVQVPWSGPMDKLERLLHINAQLTFQAVDASMTAEEARATRPPAGSALYPSAAPAHDEPHLLKREAVVSGADMEDAAMDFDAVSNQPVVSFRFNAAGARKFAEYTKANVGRPFAIVLDGKVVSAPIIREPILAGSGQISGNFTAETASELALLLRSGSFPAPLAPVEARQISGGPL